MQMPHHPAAFSEAWALVDAYDGSAEEMMTGKLEKHLEVGDIKEALKLD